MHFYLVLYWQNYLKGEKTFFCENRLLHMSSITSSSDSQLYPDFLQVREIEYSSWLKNISTHPWWWTMNKKTNLIFKISKICCECMYIIAFLSIFQKQFFYWKSRNYAKFDPNYPTPLDLVDPQILYPYINNKIGVNYLSTFDG